MSRTLIQKTQQVVDIEARRARVAELMIRKWSYREIGVLLGVSDSTISGDAKALRKQWAKTYTDVGALFAQAAMDQDWLQRHIIELIGSLQPEDQSPAIGRLISLLDQRNKLHGLYPKAGTGEEAEVPTGPIRVQFEILDAGNQKLVLNQDGEKDEE